MLTFRTDNLFSLYIHWPFCRSKCFYCDFIACEKHEEFYLKYHIALLKEIIFFAQSMPKQNQSIKTIFIGGGTPSLYPLELMEELFYTLECYFMLNTLEEVSIEANPVDITEERLDAWVRFGITRLSIGIQILDDQVLAKMNRRQRITDVFEAVKIIPKYFDNFSTDFILGLPEVTDKMWIDTLEQAMKWEQKHISIYFLSVHEQTPLYYKVKQGRVVLPSEESLIKNYELAVCMLENNGFKQYEISNFARPGYSSVHNRAYWNHMHYKGFGIGASSFDGKKRFINEKNLKKYINALLIGDFPCLKAETLTRRQKSIEAVMLGLRQKKGIDLHRMVYLLNYDEKKSFLENIEKLKSISLVEEKNGKLLLTLKGMMLENEVILKLM
jgi:putative oxygen-independent coproporphyrinogen III oxidase